MMGRGELEDGREARWKAVAVDCETGGGEGKEGENE
jgi:hypothetical protein